MEALDKNHDSRDKSSLKWRELLTFFILAFAIWPIIAIGVVGAFGFLVWMFQLLYGPPGPPAG